MKSLAVHVKLVKQLEFEDRVQTKCIPIMRLGLKALMLLTGRVVGELLIETIEGA